MKKMENPRIARFSYEKNRLSNHQRQSRFSVQRPSPYLLNLRPKFRQNLSEKICVPSGNYQKVKEILEWRRKTQFPIVKVKSWKDIQTVILNGDSHIQMKIQLESSFKSLKQIQNVTLIQAIYILKESLIGFDRLFYRFGKFRPTNSMIFFDSNGYCKVWINQNLYENFSQPSNIDSQKDFIKIICCLIKEKTSKSKKSLAFFNEIQSCSCFFNSIAALRNFIKENNMQIPCSLKINSFQLQHLQKRRDQSKSVLKQKLTNQIVQNNKVPTFLKQLAKSKIIQTNNLSFHTKNQNSLFQIRKKLKSQKKNYESEKNIIKKSIFSKCPSHKLFSVTKAIIQENEVDESILLRETLKFGSNFKFDIHQVCQDKDEQKQSFVTTQTSFSIKTGRKDFKKLFQMGRFITQSQQTIKCQFELEYGQKIVKENLIRNQLTNLLS